VRDGLLQRVGRGRYRGL